jgi:hypothetical protein
VADDAPPRFLTTPETADAVYLACGRVHTSGTELGGSGAEEGDAVRRGPERQVRLARYLGLFFVAGGFALIGFGWNGAARTASTDSQLPYLVSGGASGIGCIVLGVGLLLVGQIRSERQRLQGILDAMGPAARQLPAAEASVSTPEGFLFRTRHARILSLAFVFAGFVAIVLGWIGMARSGAPDEQLPFIVSGGMGGIGLIAFGVGILLVAQIRTERQSLTAVLEIMARAVAKVTGGHPLAEEEEGGPPADTLVVAGPSTFHRPECKLVTGKPGLDRLTIQVARSTGLSPCRICDPLDLEKRGQATEVPQPVVATSEQTQETTRPSGS